MAGKYLVADLFCGAGGSSTGAKRAIAEIGGEMDLVAINHWNTAIATHSANHPAARHLVEDVSLVDPEAVVEEGRLDLLMASPECKFYSRARGGKPVHDQGRMNPWAIHNWLTKLDVRCVLIENVPEFIEWGPLLPNGKPDKTKKGLHFQAWFLAFNSLGYQAEWKMLNAADFGDATTRVRFFLMARNDGRPVVWPEPTHAKVDTPMFPGKLPWRGAREVIDWTNPGRSLLDDPKYRKKPLSEKTRKRIARGLERFGGPLAPLYIRLLDLPGADGFPLAADSEHPGGPFILNRPGENGHHRSQPVEEPMPTATGRGAGYLVQPDAEPFVVANRTDNTPKGVDEPVPVVTTAHGGGSFLVQPFLLGQQSGGAPRSVENPLPTIAAGGAIALLLPDQHPFMLTHQSGVVPRPVDEPVPTITTRGPSYLAEPSIIQYYGNSHAQAVDAPLSVITSMNKHGLVCPTLVEYYSRSNAADVDQPLPTVTTRARHGLVSPTLVEVNHGDRGDGDAKGRRALSLDEPLPPQTTKRGVGLASPVLVQTSQTGGNGGYSRSPKDPMPVVTSCNDIKLVTPTAKPYLVANFGERDGQGPRVHHIEDPVPTVTSRGAGSLVSPLLEESFLQQVQEANIDPRRIVLVDGHLYLLDIRFRMLQNAELARAMGFEDEEAPYEFHGTITEVTKQIGNAVPVNMAAALVKSALGGEQE